MPKTDALALSILDRMIEQREQQLRNAELTSNTSLAQRVRRELKSLQADRKKLGSGKGTTSRRSQGAEVFSIGSRSGPVRRMETPRARKSSRRPSLLDESTVVPPHSARWEELSAYILYLNDQFPGEDTMSLAGMFSTEREFARHIRSLESRLPTRSRRKSSSRATAAKKSPRKKAAKKKVAKTARKKAVAKSGRKKATRKATPRKKATRKASPRKSASRSRR